MFQIKEIVSANEIIVTPNWFWEGYEGNRVWIKGFNVPKEEFKTNFAKNKLISIIDNKPFELKDPKFWEAFGKDIIACYVYKDGVDISYYFPEFGGKL